MSRMSVLIILVLLSACTPSATPTYVSTNTADPISLMEYCFSEPDFFATRVASKCLELPGQLYDNTFSDAYWNLKVVQRGGEAHLFVFSVESGTPAVFHYGPVTSANFNWLDINTVVFDNGYFSLLEHMIANG